MSKEELIEVIKKLKIFVDKIKGELTTVKQSSVESTQQHEMQIQEYVKLLAETNSKIRELEASKGATSDVKVDGATDEKIVSLENELLKYKNGMNKMMPVLKDYKEKMQQKDEEIKLLKDEIGKCDALSLQNDELKSKIEQLNASSNASVNIASNANKSDDTDLKIMISKLQNDLASKVAESESSGKKADELDNNCKALASKISELETQLATKDSQHKTLSAQIAELESQVSGRSGESQALSGRISDLESQVASKSTECAALQSNVEELQLQLGSLNSVQAANHEAVAALEAQVILLNQEKAESTKVFDTFRERAKQSLKKTLADQQQAETKIAEITETLNNERSKVAELKQRLDETTSKNSNSHQNMSLLVKGCVERTLTLVHSLKVMANAMRKEVNTFIDIESRRSAEFYKRFIELNSKVNNSNDAVKSNNLVTQLEELKLKEKQLVAEMKRRGDAARGMISDKEKELTQVKQEYTVMTERYSQLEASMQTRVAKAMTLVAPKASDEERPQLLTPSTLTQKLTQQDSNNTEMKSLMETITSLQTEITVLRSRQSTLSGHDEESENVKFEYLKKAFIELFKHNGVEMQHLARVICALLGIGDEDQAVIISSIKTFSQDPVGDIIQLFSS
jgi:chromosome segregation ATPase